MRSIALIALYPMRYLAYLRELECRPAPVEGASVRLGAAPGHSRHAAA